MENPIALKLSRKYYHVCGKTNICQRKRLHKIFVFIKSDHSKQQKFTA